MSSTGSPSAEPPTPSRGQSWALMAEADYRNLWCVGVVSHNTRWMEVVAVSIYVYDVTGSPLVVSLVMLVRTLPMALLGATIGALAARFDRKRIVVWSMAVLAIQSAVLGFLAYTGALSLWMVYAGALISGTSNATDFPCRRTLMADAVGPSRISGAMALEGLTQNITRLMGPAVGGLFMETAGLHGAYFLSAALAMGGLLLAQRVSLGAPQRGGPAPRLAEALIEGWRYALTKPVIMAALTITVLANSLAYPFTAMMPVIGKEVLEVGPFLVGLLVSGHGLGALLGSLVLVSRPVSNVSRAFLYGNILLVAPLIGFAFSPWYLLSIALLMVSGLGQAVFASCQGAVILLHAAPEMHTRAMGLVVTSIGTQPVGFFLIGLLATWYGAVLATAACAALCLAGLIGVALKWPDARR